MSEGWRAKRSSAKAGWSRELRAAPPRRQRLYSRRPECIHHEPWELQCTLYSLNYTDDLADEEEIAAAVEVARSDGPQWRAA